MKIYYVISSLEGGGAEFIIPDLADFFKSQGHSFKVLACLPRDMETAALLEKRNVPYQLLSLNGDNRLKSTYNLYKAVKKSPPDLIWTSLSRGTMDGQIIGKLCNIPVVSWKHSANLRAYKAAALRFLQRYSQFWVADSDGVADFLQTGMDVSADRVMTWPLFKVPESLPKMPVWDGNGVFHIGSMGRLHPVKNFHIMIKSIDYINQKYPEVGTKIHFSIAGAGGEEQKLQNLIQKLQLNNVELVGFYSNVMDYLKTLHLYTQTSTYEGMCIALHEALAAGLPVISSSVGEMRFCVKNNPIGTLLDENSPEALGEAIVEYFHNPAKTTEYAQNARNYIQSRYSPIAFQNAGKAILNRIETEILPSFQKY
ncbi:glycosyltransferase [Commensalibacter papalotli (ex Botero et al. 2024)]|uniref:Glycosyltransferase involved in cell wall bisynthesis (RfaB) (PDB:2IV7) n=1 Tax=Commensalibacter papalotli (ex Botero et al. 2024) TaxID=2972766 RepID=A0ABM9HUG0_9PROT|nr:glycosyltransferase [Commensalibacter papalotli (ex Botero et al. 2024)]CAI3957106.1 Glycosyltransferase involved in cell wall bisynthesis (RfaB) (PDB:2IV7) [Commensalibacter papalotli (ex Botero et al. 2024)]CAI3957730.1 Glycosyltransferase involved in cell wall bisynthesis (RfaB) (PDB:2IV7) [Commensalibacter papalotli (ex Botero et al. 2024)]